MLERDGGRKGNENNDKDGSVNKGEGRKTRKFSNFKTSGNVTKHGFKVRYFAD